MKKVTILIPESSVIQSIADPQYLFSAVNQFLQQSNAKPQFIVELAGLKKEVIMPGGNFIVRPDRLIDEIHHTDVIIIPALFGNMKEAVALNKAFLPWIQKMHDKGSEIVSLCVGAFLLAATGLLNGKKCSTHWSFRNQFQELYPEVLLTSGSIVTEEHRIYSSGGAHSYWNLLLHLVEKYTNHSMAVLVSKYFAIDFDRKSQLTFAIFNGQKNHADEAILKAQNIIESTIPEKVSVDSLADKVSVGRRSFERRFKKATQNTVLEYIQRVRIEAAKRSFESSDKNIFEVMTDVGYSDSKAFRSTFKKLTGLTPVAYRKKYSKKLL